MASRETTFLPPRRWFQFRLSTWFVLVGIVAWALVSQPFVVESLGPRAGIMSGPPWDPIYVVERRPNLKLIYPALALAAFLSWKLLWLVVERRRRTQEYTARDG